MALPNETQVYCGHEYSVKNLEFALKLEPENDTIESKLQLMRQMVKDGHFTVGSPLVDERLYNPFVRCFGADLATKEYFADITGESTDTTSRVFQKIRALKDKF